MSDCSSKGSARHSPISIPRSVDELREFKNSELLNVANFILASNVNGEEVFVDQINDVLPWISILSADDQQICVRELTNVAKSAVEGGDTTRFSIELESWHETAIAIAAGWDQTKPRGLNQPTQPSSSRNYLHPELPRIGK